MKNNELTSNAAAFADAQTFYEYGGWGQTMTREELDRLANLYPKNKPVNYDNVGKWGFDCICFVKGLLAGVTVRNHVNDYNAIRNCPIGDCTPKEFMNKLYDCVQPKDAGPGYGLATEGHAAIALGDGRWIDANRNGTQDGIKIHTTGIERFTKCGKIPGVEYSGEPVPVPDKREILMDFVTWLVDNYLK